MVAISGDNIVTGTLYPKLTVDVYYCIYGTKTKVKYERTVTFSKVYDTKVFADVNVDLRKIESSLTSAARATVRTANYLDGNQVTIFDDLNICANKSLQNDMCSAIKSVNKEIIKDRSETIEECLSKIR